MRKYEYLILYDADEEKMNQMGIEGWELVSTIYIPSERGDDSTVFYFKRDKELKEIHDVEINFRKAFKC